MEQSPDPNHSSQPAGCQPPVCGLHSKRLKELENAALQNTIVSSQMDSGSAADARRETEVRAGENQLSNGSSLEHRAASSRLSTDTAPEDMECQEVEEEKAETYTRVEEERTLTDHLNKRLLSSFLEKLNQRDLALPGVGRLDCAIADDEDSNKAADEW